MPITTRYLPLPRRLMAVLLLAGHSLSAQPNGSAERPASESSVARPDLATPEQRNSAQRLLEDYVRQALANSPSLSSLRAKQASAQEMVQPAGALPDPMVGVMYQSMGPPWQPMPPMSMAQAELSQTIPGVGKRQARRNAAEAEVKMREVELSAARAQIAAAVRGLFAQIYASDREQRAMESARALIELMAGTITGQFSAGRVDQEALAKVAIERSKLEERLLDIQTDRELLVAKLNRLLARRESQSVPRIEALPDVAVDTNRFTEHALTRAPELRVQRALIAAAARRRENAETETRPNFLVGLAGGATTTGEPVFTLRLGMELPIWRASKQDPMIRAARKDVEAAEGEYRAMELKLRGEIAELTARLRRDTAQLELYRDSILPNTELALNAARNAYASGRGDFATVIEDFRLWLDARIAMSRREADRLMAWAELEALWHEMK